MAIFRNHIHLDDIVKKGDWVNWGMLVDKDDILSVAGGLRPGKVEKVRVGVTKGFPEAGTCRECHIDWRC